MKKALISAFACDPNMGSEPYVGWNWLLQTLHATNRNVILLTRKMHVNPVLQELPAEFRGRVEVMAFDLWGASKLDHRHRRMKAYYVLWQVAALFLVMARQLAKLDIAVIHQCTYNVADMPGFLWAIPGSKFIWGPIGGGQVPPHWADRIYGQNWPRELRRAKMKKLIRWNPLVILASLKARRILVANEDTLAVLPNLSRNKVIKTLETAINTPITARKDTPFERANILWVGQLEARKALQILIDAVALIKTNDHKFYSTLDITVIGTGPEESEMKELCIRRDVADAFRFTGAIPYSDVQQAYRNADIFAFTSVQDTSGNVVLEALANGIPCIAFNHQGAREIISHGGGILIDACSYEDATKGFASAITRIAQDRDLMRTLSQQATRNITDNFLWKHKTPMLSEIHDEIQQSTNDSCQHPKDSD